MSTVIIRPDSAGDATALTPTGAANNWDCVDESSADDDTTYVITNADTAQVDYYNMTASGLTTETIDGVDVFARTRSSGVQLSGGTVTIGLRLSSTNTLAAPHVNTNDSSWNDFSDTSIADPLGGSYSVSDVDALQFALKLDNGAGARINPTLRCTQAYATVTYHVASGTRTPIFVSRAAVMRQFR